AAKSTATNKNSLYDSYLRAFRWATDRIGDQGVVAFVSNGGWIDGNTGDGVRLSMAEDFTDLYVFNLRGNQRTAGEQSRREGGKVFGSGSRNTVAITIGIKDSNESGFQLHYRDIGDYLSAEEKLKIVDTSIVDTVDWQTITPNFHGDWLNQRSDDFATWPVLGEKKGNSTKFFTTFSAGLQTNRDAWAYSFSKPELYRQVQTLGASYEEALQRFQKEMRQSNLRGEAQVTEFLKANPSLADPKHIKWSRSLRQSAFKGEGFEFDRERGVHSLYRPFCMQNVYFDKLLNHER